jgi:transposase
MQREYTKPDYAGQNVYIALDTGNKSWKTCIMTESLEHGTFTQPPQSQVLVKYLHRHFPGARYHCVYEAGYQGYWIQRELMAAGIDTLVVNPADVPTTHKEQRRKTNGVDARKLCRTLRSGELEGIFVPSAVACEDRSLIRNRHCFVKKQTRCKNQIKAFLSFYGIKVPEERLTAYWSQRYMAWLRQIPFRQTTGKEAFHALLDEMVFQREMIARLTKQIRLLAATDQYHASVEYLRSINGISTLSAMTLLTELMDIHRFGTLDQLASYCGLIPDERSTGEDQTLIGITHRRNALLRATLIECSWVAARKDPHLLLAFNEFAKRMPKTKAIIRIARKVLNRIRFVLINQQPYTGTLSQAVPAKTL